MSYPRSGNTWLRYMLSLAVVGRPLSLPEMESTVFDIYKTRRFQLERVPSPRLLKSHESFRPEYGRVVYLVREPCAVALSYLNYSIGRRVDQADSETVGAFIAAYVDRGVGSFGTWREHVLSWSSTRGHSEDFLLVSYEKLKEDPGGVLAQVLRHFEIDPLMPVEEAVALSSRDVLLRLELEGDGSWRRSEGLQGVTFFGGESRSVRAHSALDRSHCERIEAAFSDARALLGFS